jgi:hypothetical protein
MRLPPFIFLIGPKGCGKTTLATLLCEQDNSIAHCSFDEPIREATLQIFFPEQLHMGLDLREDDAMATALPFTAISIGTWMDNLRRTLTGISPTLIGDLAKKRLGYIQGRFQTFAFDDAESTSDISPFVLAYGSNNCLLIFIERSGHPIAPYLSRFSFLPKLVVRNPEGKQQEMLEHLGRMLPAGVVNNPNLMPEGEVPHVPEPTTQRPPEPSASDL